MNKQVKEEIKRMVVEKGLHPEAYKVLVRLFQACGGDITTLGVNGPCPAGQIRNSEGVCVDDPGVGGE